MAGYIVNCDKAWFEHLLKNKVNSPVFWFKREENPSPKFILPGNSVFFRVTETSPPVIRAYAIIGEIKTYPVKAAFKKFGIALGYSSLNQMIESSSKWTSSTKLNLGSKICCIKISDFKIIEGIQVDSELEELGIVFDYQHIVTGKGLNDNQSHVLQNLAHSKIAAGEDDHITVQEPLEEYLRAPGGSTNFLEAHLQWFVFKNLNCLNIPGVKLYDEKRQLETQGKYYTDEVGEIDLLLITPNKEIVVVELKKTGTDKTIGQIARYMGWVKHRLAQKDQKVSGVIVTQDYDHRLAYAASVIPSLTVQKLAIEFKIDTEFLQLPE